MLGNICRTRSVLTHGSSDIAQGTRRFLIARPETSGTLEQNRVVREGLLGQLKSYMSLRLQLVCFTKLIAPCMTVSIAPPVAPATQAGMGKT